MWVFDAGMLFGAENRWWGDRGGRDGPHEGIDLSSYRTKEGEIRHLDENSRVPVIFSGRVMSVIDDFLGRSVFVKHAAGRSGRHLYTIYGHLKPSPGTQTGMDLSEGDIIGTIADAREKRATIRSHLHISVAWVPDSLQPEELDWRVIADPDRVELIDPLRVIDCPHTTLQP
jgi:murein DD-endopeptidase MepM/ murein hydrolase activator NlpD